MTRVSRRDGFGTYAPLRSRHRGQPTVRELVEERARLEAPPPIVPEAELPELSPVTGREVLTALVLVLAAVVVRLLIR